MHGFHFRPEPAHGLQGGVVVTELSATAQEVLLLKDHHAAAVVRLWSGWKGWLVVKLALAPFDRCTE